MSTNLHTPYTIAPLTVRERQISDWYNATSCMAEDMAQRGDIPQAQAEAIKDVAWAMRAVIETEAVSRG